MDHVPFRSDLELLPTIRWTRGANLRERTGAVKGSGNLQLVNSARLSTQLIDTHG